MRFSRRWSVAVMLAAACSGSPQDSDSLAAPAAAVEALEGQTFRLRPGQVARLRGADLYVGFRGISVDSRCPSDVVCVWEGDATARLQLSTDGETYRPVDLHTAIDPKSVEFAGRTLTLLAVEPYPVSSSPIDPARYVVTLKVE